MKKPQNMKNLYLIALFVGFNVFSQELPNISLQNIEGKSVSVKNDFIENDKIYVFSFWATWCGPCVNELDEMNELQEEWKKTLTWKL